MPSTVLRLAAAGAAALITGALPAQAQTAPPIKPGLWQVTPQQAAGGQPPADFADRLKNMPPEVRKQLEASMKTRGMDVTSGGLKICHTKESLEQGRWQGQQMGCKTDFKTRTATSWTWHSSCAQPPSQTDGEIVFTNAENYIVKTSTKATVGGQAVSSQNMQNAKWLGANCGDLKPFSPPPAPK
jgi:hypothetical protein